MGDRDKLETGGFNLGTCTEMCPTAEWKMREKHRLLHHFEVRRDPISHRLSDKADPSRCVKEFTRAAAGLATPSIHSIRPPPILLKTIEYLFDQILTISEEKWITIYDFVFDRLRAVRQDMVVQAVWWPECVTAYEYIIRFHIYSIYRLCEEPISVYDPHINATHLQECLKRLLVWYYDQEVQSSTRNEMEAFYLLFNLNSVDAARHCLTLPHSVRSDPVFQTAFRIYLAWLNGNFVSFSRNLAHLPFLFCVAVMPHISSVRRSALRAMNAGYSAKNCKFPISVLTKMLLFGSEVEAKEECLHYGIKVEGSSVCFLKTSFDADAPTVQIRKFGFMRKKHNTLRYPSFLYDYS